MELLGQRGVQACAQVLHSDASPVRAQDDWVGEVRLVPRLLREGPHLRSGASARRRFLGGQSRHGEVGAHRELLTGRNVGRFMQLSR